MSGNTIGLTNNGEGSLYSADSLTEIVGNIDVVYTVVVARNGSIVASDKGRVYENRDGNLTQVGNDIVVPGANFNPALNGNGNLMGDPLMGDLRSPVLSKVGTRLVVSNRLFADPPAIPLFNTGRVRVYNWNEQRFSWDLELNAIGMHKNERLGSGTAINADGTLLVIGAGLYTNANSTTQSGIVYIYQRTSSSTWLQRAILEIPEAGFVRDLAICRHAALESRRL